MLEGVVLAVDLAERGDICFVVSLLHPKYAYSLDNSLEVALVAYFSAKSFSAGNSSVAVVDSFVVPELDYYPFPNSSQNEPFLRKIGSNDQPSYGEDVN